MSRRTRLAGMDVPTFAWCGRLAFTVERARDGGYDSIEILFRMDTVEIKIAGRCLAICDRDLLRLWLARPRNPFEIDEMELRWEADEVWMTTSTNRRFALPSGVETSLRARA